jgi:hypothetical protein
MSDHYIVALDQGHLRIYLERRGPSQFTPGLEAVESKDFPAGREAYTDRDTDMAGRFQGSSGRAGANGGSRGGMSIDERLPMKNETNKRRAEQLAAEVERFFAPRPDATWDFAAGPELHRAVLELLSPKTRQRLRRALPKDLVNQPPNALREQFALR